VTRRPVAAHHGGNDCAATGVFWSDNRPNAVLVLEDGHLFPGRAFGAVGRSMGEVVFCTGMTGYEETLTDPSYYGQIAVATAPHIGNTGWNPEDEESGRIWVSGYVVRDPAVSSSSWRSSGSLEDELRRQQVVGMCHVDTRRLTMCIRERGAMRAGIFSGDSVAEREALVAAVRSSATMAGADLTAAVTTRRRYVVPAVGGQPRLRVATLDLGVKSSTLRMMAARGVETHVLPASATADEILAMRPDGLLLPNGPGDPATAAHAVAVTREFLSRRISVFGICFGNQILGRALGLATYKLGYGHRGLNVPVIDVFSGRVAITAQNHGFALTGEPGQRFDSPFGPVVISQYCPNDGTAEGLRCEQAPAFSVQYHPEAAAGPHDAASLFDDFVDLMERKRVG
jgi:carbamoyl-phosphate synthase small subunit